MEGFDFFGLQPKKAASLKPGSCRAGSFPRKLKSGEWASGNLNVDQQGNLYYPPDKTVDGNTAREP